MNSRNNKSESPTTVDAGRRGLLKTVGAGALLAATPSTFAADRPIRWGIVGTGGIANGMVGNIRQAAGSELAAVSSRKMETAKEFATKHGIPGVHDSWQKMVSSKAIDAVYIATPTSAREEIGVFAANHGKHVLGEKPFANLPSLKRITAACRKNGVGFMDGTHFVHHPRTAQIKSTLRDKVGFPVVVDSAFRFNLPNADNIRLNPELEPYGAIGDAAWYNMRAAVEYTPPGVKLVGADGYARRDKRNNAVIAGSGIIAFDDGSTTTWDCAFDAGAANMDLKISGPGGQVSLRDFVFNPGKGPAEYEYRKGGFGDGATTERISVPSEKSHAVLMFEDFAAMVGNPELFEASVTASERTQEWLDAIWNAAVRNGRG